MRTNIQYGLIAAFVCTLVSCGDNKKSTEKDIITKDTTANNPGNNAGNNVADSSLLPLKDFIVKGLYKWTASFKGFQLDSFRMTQKSNFEWGDAEAPADLQNFFELYKGTLIYSPDSSLFLDLYSSNIWLEKKGKKIIAIGDPDQTIVLANTVTNDWRRIVFFGPSAGIEEAAWPSASQFILAGTMSDEEGKNSPIILVGDMNSRTLRWFESNIKRTSDYSSGSMSKLKIDEWE